MLEEKSADEMADEGAVKDVELLDDTESMRTVLAHVNGFNEVQRYQVNLDWTLSQLLEFLIVQFELGGEQRLRNVTVDKMFFKEEMANKLKNYESFREGGTRIQIELGRPCTLAEITVNVV